MSAGNLVGTDPTELAKRPEVKAQTERSAAARTGRGRPLGSKTRPKDVADQAPKIAKAERPVAAPALPVEMARQLFPEIPWGIAARLTDTPELALGADEQALRHGWADACNVFVGRYMPSALTASPELAGLVMAAMAIAAAKADAIEAAVGHVRERWRSDASRTGADRGARPGRNGEDDVPAVRPLTVASPPGSHRGSGG